MNQKSQTPYFHHYTTDDGFKGIIESQELWATSIYYLNDYTEFYHGRDAFIKSVKELLKDKEIANGAAVLLSYLFDAKPPLFVCSFSSAEDDINQWQAYSPKGGYAIGFPVDKLFAYAGMIRFDLVRCEYFTENIQNTAKSMVEIIENIIQTAGGIKKFRSQFPFTEPSRNPLLKCILMFVARYKEEKFISEQEHRLLYIPEIYEHPRSRTLRNKQVPFMTLSLSNDASWKKLDVENLWKHAKIFVSPNLPAIAEQRRESVRKFLESELQKHDLPTDCTQNIHLSEIPTILQ